MLWAFPTGQPLQFFSFQDIRSIERETAELLKRRMRGDDAEDTLEAEGEHKVFKMDRPVLCYSRIDPTSFFASGFVPYLNNQSI